MGKERAITITLLLLALIPFAVAEGNQSVDFLDRLLSGESIPDNNVCDDGEYLFLDSDCKFSLSTILSEMWFIKLLLLLAIILIIKKSDKSLFIIILIVALLVYNGDAGSIDTPKEIPRGEDCGGLHFFENLGDCLIPSNPMLGWALIGIVILYLLYRVFKI